MLPFHKLYAGEMSFDQVVAGVTPADLVARTNEIYDAVEAPLSELRDDEVVFVPGDPTPDDPEAEGWTIGHVIVHLTAGCEETAAFGLTLARGVEITGRMRYESPWEGVTTAEQVWERLRESRRMVLAMLSAWPDVPHLEMTHTQISRLGPMDAVGLHLCGYMHATMHLNQLAEIRRQAAAARVSA